MQHDKILVENSNYSNIIYKNQNTINELNNQLFNPKIT